MFLYNVNLQGRAWEIHWEGKGETKEGGAKCKPMLGRVWV